MKIRTQLYGQVCWTVHLEIRISAVNGSNLHSLLLQMLHIRLLPTFLLTAVVPG